MLLCVPSSMASLVIFYYSGALSPELKDTLIDSLSMQDVLQQTLPVSHSSEYI